MSLANFRIRIISLPANTGQSMYWALGQHDIGVTAIELFDGEKTLETQ